MPGPVPASPANNSYKPGFASALMLKDLNLAQAAAAAAGADTPMGARAREIYERFVEEGGAELDFSAVIGMLRKN